MAGKNSKKGISMEKEIISIEANKNLPGRVKANLGDLNRYFQQNPEKKLVIPDLELAKFNLNQWINKNIELISENHKLRMQLAAVTTATCIWYQDSWESEIFVSSCKNDFVLNDGTPSTKGLKYCCYCGRQIKELLYEDKET
jgi:hypothetical protein